MYILTVKSIEDLITTKAVVIDPEFKPKSHAELRQHLLEHNKDSVMDSIVIPWQINRGYIDLTEFLHISTFAAERIHSVNDNKPFTTLRAYIVSDYAESSFMIDLVYSHTVIDNEYYCYKLESVIVYDERSDTFYKEEYAIKGSTTGYATLMLDTINMVMEVTMHIESNRINNALGDPNIGGMQC
nr:MAG TPA: hypothetical protein [Caudoviricetes sp.]